MVSKSRSRVLRIFRDGAIAFVSGLALALLSVIPEGWLSGDIKFWMAVSVIIVTVVAIFAKVFYDDLREYLRAKKLIDQYYGLMPRILRLRTNRREFFLREDGNAEVIHDLEIVNTSQENIPMMQISQGVDMIEPPPADGKYVNIDKILIGTSEIINPSDRCYKKIGVLDTGSGKKEQGNIVIPFSEVGGIPPRGDRTVKIHLFLFGVFKNLKEGEYTRLHILHPTDKAESIIHAPNDWHITLDPTADYPYAISVHDRHAGILDMRVTQDATKPILKNESRTIEWVISKPRINYTYTLYFKVVR